MLLLLLLPYLGDCRGDQRAHSDFLPLGTTCALASPRISLKSSRASLQWNAQDGSSAVDLSSHPQTSLRLQLLRPPRRSIPDVLHERR